MKLQSRDFTIREKILILILTLILIALAYYQFVDQPVRLDTAAAIAERDALQLELTAVQARARQVERMEDELKCIGALESASRMASYNNSEAELDLLNGVLETAEDYTISFGDVTRDGDQVRRNFSLQYTSRSFDEAKTILSRLSSSEYRCLLGDVRYSVTRPDNLEGSELITVNTTATFYETMYEGKPDAGLTGIDRP